MRTTMTREPTTESPDLGPDAALLPDETMRAPRRISFTRITTPGASFRLVRAATARAAMAAPSAV